MFELKNILVRTWVLIVFICLWEILVYFKIWSPALIASPHDTLIDLISLIADGQLWMHLSTSLSRIFWGALSGTIIGSVFGLLLGTFKNFKLQLSLIISIIYSIPPLALIPFFIIAFGIGEFTKIALIFITFFIISSLHASDGILQTHQNFIHLADLYEKSYLTKILDIWLPSSLSHIFTGFRLALFNSWNILITSEIIASSSGIGWFLWSSRQFSRSDDMMVAILTIGVLGFLSDWMIIQAQQRLLHWQEKMI